MRDGDPEAARRPMRLRELRSYMGVTQVDLAARMGTAQQHVSGIENRPITSLRPGTLRAYLEALGGAMRLVAVIDGDEWELV
jgi:transcriptional regulator with XRE-family HTH domain